MHTYEQTHECNGTDHHSRVAFVCSRCETPAVGLMADGAGTSVMRRRQGRLRAMLRHERQTVAMELAAALHHSRDAGPGTYDGLQAQKTASSGKRLTEPEAQVGAVTVGNVAAPGPLLLHTVAGGHCC